MFTNEIAKKYNRDIKNKFLIGKDNNNNIWMSKVDSPCINKFTDVNDYSKFIDKLLEQGDLLLQAHPESSLNLQTYPMSRPTK